MPPYQNQNGNQPQPGQSGSVPPYAPQGQQPVAYNPPPAVAQTGQPAPYQPYGVTTAAPPAQPYGQPAAPYMPPQAQQQPGAYHPSPNSAGHSGQAEPHNPYGFFLDPPAAPKKSMLGNAGNSMAMRLLIVLGGLTALLILGAVLFSLLTNKPDNTERLLAIANDQQELIRVSDMGTKDAESSKLRNSAYTTKVTLLSAQQELIAHITATGVEVEPKKLGLTKDEKTDKALETAQAANTYDSTFTGIMQLGITNYQKKLNQASQGAASPKERALLKKQHDTAALLLKQLGAPPLQ